MPDLYLCLDARPINEQALESIGDSVFFNGAGALLIDPTINSEHWQRNWRAFTKRDEAVAYAKDNMTVIAIPLDVDATAIDEMP